MDQDGDRLIRNLTEWWDCTPSMLAGLLGVTITTLNKWRNLNISELQDAPKANRVIRLHQVISTAIQNGVPPKLTLNLVMEEVDKDGCDLMCYILDDPSDPDIDRLLSQCIKKFLEDK